MSRQQPRIRNRSLVGLGSRSYFRSLTPLHKSEYHQDIDHSLKLRAHCKRSVGRMCSSTLPLPWARGGTNADTMGVCLCVCCRHHFSEWVTQSQWFESFEWNDMITHGIAHLQFQMNMTAKTRQKRRKNNNSHNVTEVMQRGRKWLKKMGKQQTL